jgi:uroporphyrinogen decarboxylase
MTLKRDIIKALLAKEIPERVGLFEQFWPFICENSWAEQGVPVGTDFITRFDLDMRHTAWFVTPGPRPDLVRTVAETDEWTQNQDAWGAQTKLWKKKAGTPEHFAYTITSPDIWRREFREAALAIDMHTAIDLELVRKDHATARANGEFSLFSTVLCFEDLRRVLGDVTMLESIILEPDWIHDFNQIVTRKSIEGLEILFREVGLPDGIHVFDDLAYTQGPFVSPACHREFVLPYHKQVVDFLKAYQVPVFLHTCGDFRPHLPAIVEAGFDGIQTMEAKTGMNVLKLAEQYKDKLCFIGNLDIRAFESGDRDRIREECLGKLNGMKKLRAPYVFMSDHSIPPSVKVADYEFVLGLYRENCRY